LTSRPSQTPRPLLQRPPLSGLSVAPLDAALGAALQAKADGLAKPLASLGRLEALAVRIGQIQGRLDPQMDQVRAYVFAGDHGFANAGASAYPASVTAAMAATFLAGKASVNALARSAKVDVRVVDAGIDAVLAPHPLLIEAKVRRGSRNAAEEPALTADEVNLALDRGAALAAEAAAEGMDGVIPGEMGIGNSTSAALLMHRLTEVSLTDCLGAGAGQDEAGMARKTALAERAAARTSAKDPFQVLCEFGGLEIAMMAGFVIGAAALRRVVIVDGFISSAAALVAVRLRPEILPYCIFAHTSAERGHRRLLEALGGEALLDLGMRLGEGSGAVLSVPILRSAAALIRETASLEDVLAGRL